jgi:hypothetical protein
VGSRHPSYRRRVAAPEPLCKGFGGRPPLKISGWSARGPRICSSQPGAWVRAPSQAMGKIHNPAPVDAAIGSRDFGGQQAPQGIGFCSQPSQVTRRGAILRVHGALLQTWQRRIEPAAARSRLDEPRGKSWGSTPVGSDGRSGASAGLRKGLVRPWRRGIPRGESASGAPKGSAAERCRLIVWACFASKGCSVSPPSPHVRAAFSAAAECKCEGRAPRNWPRMPVF